jgi:hypothetical protein
MVESINFTQNNITVVTRDRYKATLASYMPKYGNVPLDFQA